VRTFYGVYLFLIICLHLHHLVMLL